MRAFPTEDGGMPVDAADPLVLGVLLVCEGLVEHQALRDFTSPVASFHLDSQKSPVIVKHVHDLSLLKSLDDPAEVNSPTVMQIYFLLFFFNFQGLLENVLLATVFYLGVIVWQNFLTLCSCRRLSFSLALNSLGAYWVKVLLRDVL